MPESDHAFPQRRLNKAAGAADAGQCCSPGLRQDKVRVTRRICDPLTKHGAGGTPAPQLLSEDHKDLYPHNLGVRQGCATWMLEFFGSVGLSLSNLEVYNTSRKEAHASVPTQLGNAPDRTAPRSERSQRHAPWFRRRSRVPVSKAELP